MNKEENQRMVQFLKLCPVSLASPSSFFQGWLAIMFLFLLFQTGCNSGQPRAVRSGAEILIERHLPELEGKKVGLLLNQSSRTGADLSSPLTLDTLLTLGVDIRALFAPEHGIRGDVEAGGKITDGSDPFTGIPIYSLYGSSKQPPVEILEELDIILFDIQDVGARFYTYMSTMGLLLDAALPAGVEVWVLDRPNPAGGEYMSGWLLDPDYTSFVGLYPVPMVHGMTLGELALMMKGEGWAGQIQDRQDTDLQFDTASDSEPSERLESAALRVIPMEGWTRSMLWPDTGRDWVPPSPNLPTFQHAYVYLGTCLVEGTTLSEGRGTEDPFLLIGSPTLGEGQRLLDSTNSSQEADDTASHEVVPIPVLPGASVTLTEFVPTRIPGKAEYPKHKDQTVRGVRITLTDPVVYQPVESGLILLRWLLQQDPDAATTDFLYKLAGTDKIRDYMVGDGEPDFETENFRELRQPYLLY